MVAAPAGVSGALWAKQEVCHAESETCRPAWRGDRRRRWSATFTLCQRRVSHGHESVSPIHDWRRLVAAAEPTVAERWLTWQDTPSFRRKCPRGAFHAWAGKMFSRGLGAIRWPFAGNFPYGAAATSRRRCCRHRRLGRWAPSTWITICRRLCPPARGVLRSLGHSVAFTAAGMVSSCGCLTISSLLRRRRVRRCRGSFPGPKR